MTFNSAEEMYEALQNGRDLYNPVTEEYVFCYAEEKDSLCVYSLSNADADRMVKESGDGYWSTLLGSGGKIYDAPEHLDWCEEKYSLEGWTDTTDMLDRDGKPRFTFESLKEDLAEKKAKEALLPARNEKHMNRGGIEL